MTTFRYTAFMSYRRSVDEQISVALQRDLQRFSRTWYGRVTCRVFRDTTGAGIGPSLGDALRKALDESEFLILLACPDAARAPWVIEEVNYWCANRSVDNLLLIRTDGTIRWDTRANDFEWTESTAVPKVLRQAFAKEPSYLDLRWARTPEHDSDLRRGLWRDAVATLSAALLRRRKEEVIGEELRQRRRFRMVSVGLSIVLAGLTALSVFLAYRSEGRRRLAASRQVAVQALRAPRTDQGLLLGLAAVAIADTVEGRAALVSRFQQSRRLQKVISHTKEVMRLAVVSDKVIAAADEDGMVLLLTFAGERIGQLPAQSSSIVALAATSPDRLLTVLEDGRIQLWDLQTKQLAAAGRSDWPRKAHSLAISPDQMVAAVGDDDGGLHFVNLGTTDPSTDWSLAKRQVASVAWLPDRRVVIGTDAGEVAIVAVDRRQVLFRQKIGSAEIVLLGFAENRVFALDATGQLVQWHGTTAERSQLSRDVVAAGYSPERDVIAITDSEGTIRLFSRETATLVEPPLVGHSLAAVSVVFGRKGNVLVSGSFDTSVMVWDLQRAHPLQVAIHQFDGAPKAAYAPQGSLYATVASSSAIDTWELLEGEPQDRRRHRSWPVKGRPTFAISEDASRIAWATEKDAWLWSDSWSASRQVVSGSLVMRMAFTRDGKFLAFTDRTNRLLLSNDQGALKWTVQTAGDLVTALSFSANGRYLAAGDLKGTLSVYQRDTGERILEQRAVHAGVIHSLAFDRSKAVASGGGGGDRNIVMHELRSGTRTVIARGLHRGPIGALAFDSSGTLFASAANDGTVVLWDRAALRPLGPGLTGHGSFPNEVRFSPDGRRLASSDDDSVMVWNVDPQAWIKIACDIAGRELTREEWEEAAIDDEYRGVCTGNDNGGGWWRAFVRSLF